MRKMDGFTRGINLGGWLSQCRNMTEEHLNTFITEDDLKAIAEMGFDHVRLPVDYTAVETRDGAPIESGFRHVDDSVRWCAENGLHLLFDLHMTYGYTFDPMQKDADRAVFFHDEALQQRFFALWRRIAARYGKNETVAFDLLNEVVLPEVAEAWNDIADRAIAAIRPLAPETWILVGGVRYNNVASVPMLRRPADARVVYNFHCYDPMIFTHQGAYWVPPVREVRVQYPDTMAHYAAVGRSAGSTVPLADRLDTLGPIMVNSRPIHSTSAYMRSRVTPGISSTIATRWPAILLKKVDLPTLGRPTMATSGLVFILSPYIAIRAARRTARRRGSA